MKWFDHILFHTRANPEQPAIVMEDRVVTYGMLRTGIDRCAHRAASLNIPPDALVAVAVKSPIRHMTICLALFRIGVRSISIVPRQIGIEAVILAAVLCDPGDGAVLAGPGRRIVDATDDWFGVDPPAGQTLPTGFSSMQQICRVSLTSGSTGMPKAVPHRVEDIGWRILKFLDVDWSIVLCMPGLTSNWGFANSCAILAAGRTLCLAESPYQAIRMIDLFSVDFAIASTEQLLAMTRAVRKSGAQLKSLRTIWTSGSTLTRAMLEAAMIHVCKDIICLYASSETSVLAQANARDILSRPGFAGHIRPGVEIAIFGDRGERCPAGEVGALRIRLDEAYGGKPRKDGEEPPWIDIGDIGWMTADGELFIVGRAADARATGRASKEPPKISPAHEVEDLLRLEWDATDAAAVLADGPSGPQIWIGIVDNAGASADKLEAIARPRGIDLPVRLFDLPAIPRGPNGKVNRAQLKTLMLEKLGKASAA